MECLDESGQIAESGSSDRSRPLRHDQSRTAFAEPEPDRRSSASSSSPSSSASTQLSGAGYEEGPGSSAATDAEQAVDPAAETGQHQLSQTKRLAHSRAARSAARAGRTGPRDAASASGTAYAAAQHAAELSSVELRAGCCDGPRWSRAAQPSAQWLQAATTVQTEST